MGLIGVHKGRTTTTIITTPQQWKAGCVEVGAMPCKYAAHQFE